MKVRHESANRGRARKSRGGFTLLELVISCAILVSIFAIAASSLTRVHRVRAESKARSRLFIQGEEIMGFLADSFAHAAGTNIVVKGGDGSLELEIVRFEDYPPSATRGADDSGKWTVPFRRVSLNLSRKDDGSFAATRDASDRNTGDIALDAGKSSESVSYKSVSDGSRTNIYAVAKEGYGTHLLPAKKGDTILVPVTSTSTSDLYRETYGHGGGVSIVPSDNGATNILLATVVFTNYVSASATRSIIKPVAVSWPSASSNEAYFASIVHAFAENVASNDMQVSTNEWTNSVTNSWAESPSNTMYSAWTNVPLESCSLSYTNMPLSEAYSENPPTNALSATHLSATVETAARGAVGDDFVSISSNDLVRGEVLYATATNGARERIDMADFTRYLFAPEIPPALATNLLSDIPTSPPAEDFFAPAIAENNPPPFYVFQRFATLASGSVGALDMEFDLSATAESAYSGCPPVTSHEYGRRLQVWTQTEITATNASSVIAFEAVSISAFAIRVPVPAETYPTNTYLYGGTWTNLVRNGTSTDTDVRWVEYVLEEDFAGADLTQPGIWLEKGTVKASHLDVSTNSAESVAAKTALRTQDLKSISGDRDGQSFWAPVHSIKVTLLAFSNDDGRRLDLVRWKPGETTDPVCADIHLELLSPDDRKRAANVSDKNTYISRRVIRMDRRAPIGTRRQLPE